MHVKYSFALHFSFVSCQWIWKTTSSHKFSSCARSMKLKFCCAKVHPISHALEAIRTSKWDKFVNERICHSKMWRLVGDEVQLVSFVFSFAIRTMCSKYVANIWLKAVWQWWWFFFFFAEICDSLICHGIWRFHLS